MRRRSSRPRSVTVGPLLVALALVAAACGDDEPASTTAALPATTTAPATTEAAPATTEAAPATTEAAPATTEAAAPREPWDPSSAVRLGGFPSGVTAPQSIAWDGTRLIAANLPDELWVVPDPDDPSSAVLLFRFDAAGILAPVGIAWDGTRLLVNALSSRGPGFGNDLWAIPDLSDPGSAVLLGSFPSGVTRATGMTWDGTRLLVGDDLGTNLWGADPSDPGSAVLLGDFPSGVGSPQGIAWDGTRLLVVDVRGAELWRADPSDPGSAVLLGSFPGLRSGPVGLAFDGTRLLVTDISDVSLWGLSPV